LNLQRELQFSTNRSRGFRVNLPLGCYMKWCSFSEDYIYKVFFAEIKKKSFISNLKGSNFGSIILIFLVYRSMLNKLLTLCRWAILVRWLFALATQEIPNILQNLKFNYCVHKKPPIALTTIDAIHIILFFSLISPLLVSSPTSRFS
jgi:hypothetical protein